VLGTVSHLRLNVYPDGGVARLRAFAELVGPDAARLEAEPDPLASLLACNGSTAWARRMNELRPFEDAAALLRQADRVWWSLGEADHLEAFAAHPRIGGDRPAVDTGARAAAWSAGEQAGVAPAELAVRERLAAANQAYEDRFGFTFIVCATGRSAGEMLDLLEARLGHDRAPELRTAGEEQAKITRLRLAKLLGGR
jgi:allantoicase